MSAFGSPQFFSKYNSIGKEELKAAAKVVEKGILSSFVGSWSPSFYGGEQVQCLEQEMSEYFGVKHAISVNSWTSGLICAVGALGLEPGDEVIVPTWTMSATATAILVWNCVPVFADIDRDTFCISIESVKKLITPKTRAIIAVDIFGQSADVESLKDICNDHQLFLISDSAQAPNAKRNNAFAGSLSDIGGISLNYHKHIHSGEGGVIFTDNDEFALRMKLIRNHGEVVLSEMAQNERPKEVAGIVGFNFRLGEIEAAIARQQLKKLEKLTKRRSEIAKQLIDGLSDFPGIKLPQVDDSNTHVFYMFPVVLIGKALDIGRERVCRALQNNGLFDVEQGYENLHLLPIYRERNAYGNSDIPWVLDEHFKASNYEKGSCPMAEEYKESSLFLMPLCVYELSDKDIAKVLEIFDKTWRELELF